MGSKLVLLHIVSTVSSRMLRLSYLNNYKIRLKKFLLFSMSRMRIQVLGFYFQYLISIAVQNRYLQNFIVCFGLSQAISSHTICIFQLLQYKANQTQSDPMNWFTNICSCISPHLKENIINYLNSTSLNREVIEQQKVTQQSRDGSHDHEPEDHIYSFAKSKSVNFMKLDQNSDEDSDGEQKILKKNKGKKQMVKANSYNMNHNQDKQQERQQVSDEIMDVFWYPKINKNQSKMQLFRSLLAHKRKIFDIILEQQASAAQYDKVYDSLDDTNLTVHCKLQSLIKGKKINSYRFSFQIKGISIHEYSKWAKQVSPKQTLPLLQESNLIQSDPNDPSFSINHSYFKKLLVVNPQDLITASKVFQLQQQQQKTLTTIIFSVEEQKNLIEKNKKEGYHRAWLYLCGIQALQIEGGVKISGYLCIELDVSVSPNMLKQPISKQIRVFAQKMICSIRKSDEI